MSFLLSTSYDERPVFGVSRPIFFTPLLFKCPSDPIVGVLSPRGRQLDGPDLVVVTTGALKSQHDAMIWYGTGKQSLTSQVCITFPLVLDPSRNDKHVMSQAGLTILKQTYWSNQDIAPDLERRFGYRRSSTMSEQRVRRNTIRALV